MTALDLKWRAPLFALVAADAGLAIYLIGLGLDGMRRANGTGEAWVGVVFAAAGAATALLAAPALWSALRSPAGSHRRRWPRVAAAALLAALPWGVAAQFWWPASWRIPRRVDALCYDPARAGDRGEVVGKRVSGVMVMDRVFEPLYREISRDFVYRIEAPDRPTTSIAMDCSKGPRCSPRELSDADLREALAALPRCPP